MTLDVVVVVIVEVVVVLVMIETFTSIIALIIATAIFTRFR